MRYLVLTYTNGNLKALDACLAHSKPRSYDAVLCLGDLVGYGADPNAVVERVQALKPVAIVRGNHDKVACGIDQAEGFNAVARHAAHWTLEQLTPDYREWLAALPQGPTLVDDVLEICHGSPFDEDAYIFDELDAVRALKTATRPVCLFGHTHYPISFELSEEAFETIGPPFTAETALELKPGSKYLINPGSVGQPRDGDWRAAYGIVDTTKRRVEMFRLNYPIEEAQAKVIKAGLPEVLAQRLAV